MRVFPMLFGVVVAAGLGACQPAQRSNGAADTATATAATAQAAPSEAAAPGASFRATGNEPGWLAEVTTGAQPVLRVETDYGERRYEVISPSQGQDGWSGKATDGTQIKLVVQRSACQDSMSGQAFNATVMLTAGARQYHGCGDFAEAKSAPKH